MEAQQPLELAERQYKVLPESLHHKVLQLLRRRAPAVAVVGGGPGVTVGRAVGDGGRGVHGLVLPVADGLPLHVDGASGPPAVQLPLQGRLVPFGALVSRLQALLPADVDRLCKTTR